MDEPCFLFCSKQARILVTKLRKMSPVKSLIDHIYTMPSERKRHKVHKGVKKK
ncbi:uncharacterized protein TrAtP1_011573 [Trichoderma atroviride]|uniref:uncharacterized protein n=1 Tax=Hypocrea atroviridis TaxID=63577 RepID=UPI003331B474|nr:hypothetical protein TrAtP1_011573 [Trichoderma atroviride]